MNSLALFACALLVAGSSAFQLGSSVAGPALQLRGNAHCSSRASQWVSGSPSLLRTTLASPVVARQGSGMTTVRMSLFGLGWGELAVIGAIAAIIFGPKNLAGLGKDLGKIAGTLKSEAATFSEAMNESLKEAEKAVEAGEKEAKVAKAPAAIESEAPKPAAKKVDISDV